MMSYNREKIMTTFLMRDIATDFMTYARRKNLTREDMNDFAVADQFATEYMEKNPCPVLDYKLKSLNEIKEYLDEVIFSKAFSDGLMNGLNVNDTLGKNLSKIFAELMALRNKIDRNLSPKSDENDN